MTLNEKEQKLYSSLKFGELVSGVFTNFFYAGLTGMVGGALCNQIGYYSGSDELLKRGFDAYNASLGFSMVNFLVGFPINIALKPYKKTLSDLEKKLKEK